MPEKQSNALDRRTLLRGGALVGAGAVAAVGAERLLPDHGRPFHLRRRADGPVGLSVVWRADTPGRSLALTFDDGPDPRWTPRILDDLREQDVRATFFVVGERARAAPDLVRRATSEGHAIGNHTWSHRDLVAASPEAVRSEIERCHEVVSDLTGSQPVGVRPPWGRIDAVALTAVAELGSSLVLWSNSIRASDVDHDVRMTLRDATPGAIVLAHDGGPTPTDALVPALSEFVAEMRRAGWTFETIPELLGG